MTLPLFAGLVPLGALLCATLGWLVLPVPTTAGLVEEGGPIETATWAAYGLALLALGLHREVATDRRSWAAVLVVATALAARELDQHVAWTDYSVLKVSFYLGAAPVGQKIVASLFVFGFLAALAYLLVKRGAAMRTALRQRDPCAVTVTVFLATLLVSKMLDRSVSLLVQDLGVSVTLAARVLVQAIEEMLELALPLLLLVGCLQQRFAWRRRRSGGSRVSA